MIKKEGSDWAASKYTQGNKKRNFLVRAATGNMNITRRGRARLASTGMQFLEGREADLDKLVESRLYGKNFEDRSTELKKMAFDEKDDKIGEAALRTMAATGRIKDLANAEASEVGLKRLKDLASRDANFGKALYDKRRDLSNIANGDSPTERLNEMGAKELSEQHGTFFKVQRNVDAVNAQALHDLSKNMYYYDSLDTDSKNMVRSRLQSEGLDISHLSAPASSRPTTGGGPASGSTSRGNTWTPPPGSSSTRYGGTPPSPPPSTPPPNPNSGPAPTTGGSPPPSTPSESKSSTSGGKSSTTYHWGE
jgi:hypothetical protein